MVVWISLIVNGSQLLYHADSKIIRAVGFLMMLAGFIGFEIIRYKERDENRHKFNDIARNFQCIVNCFSGLYKEPEEENGEANDLS